MKTISCLFFIVLIFALWPCRTVSAGGDLIDKACEKTPYKELCKSSLRAEDESPPRADLHNLARIAVNVAWTNATDTQEYMNTLLNAATEPFMQQSLQDCDATYDDAIGNLEGSGFGV
ncbi:hypothetical protein Acr_10g0002820 [Actinidia rufa]|uniref:Pectinesterase inhibitor domain-containing protein n=1 Tax=Actinidia rufa TaxID=165716 RepID=A0A7J0FAH3_9ERIC|nr:hypothetical protein Acr_10g0002820 [Actinidia rufa]